LRYAGGSVSVGCLEGLPTLGQNVSWAGRWWVPAACGRCSRPSKDQGFSTRQLPALSCLIFTPLALCPGSGWVHTSVRLPTTAPPLPYHDPGHVLPPCGGKEKGETPWSAGRSLPTTCLGREKLLDLWVSNPIFWLPFSESSPLHERMGANTGSLFLHILV